MRRADGDEIEIAEPDEAAARVAARLGFAPGPSGTLLRAVAGEVEKARILAALRDAGLAFARGREWSPAEVFEWLREQGLLAGPFRSLSFTGPGSCRVRDES